MATNPAIFKLQKKCYTTEEEHHHEGHGTNVAEFHGLDEIWNYSYFKIISRVFKKILQSHNCVHIHPNNFRGIDSQLGIEIPRLAEFTFLRNDRILNKEYQKEFPNKLDVDNTDKEHISLPKNWYYEECI